MSVPRPIVLALALALALAACAPPRAYRAGRAAEKAGRYDEAVSYYTRAVAEHPDRLEYRKSLERAKLRAAAEHALAGRRLVEAGELEAAREELEVALALNPTDASVAEELERVVAAIDAEDARLARPPLEELKEQARERPLGRIELAPGAERPAGLLFRDASLRDVFLALGRSAGVNIVFDRDFVDRPVSVELRDTTFEEALRSICRITQNFYRVGDGNVITIVPDTPAKRREYEQQIVKTFYLSTADTKETIDLLRIVLGARRVAALTAANAVTMVDTPERIAAAERIIETIDKARPEVVVRLELLEVNRARLEEYGIQLRSLDDPAAQGIGALVGPSSETRLDEPPYRSSNVLVAGLPGALVRLLRTDSDTRVLANPRLRTVDGEAARAEFGERVPIPITTFTPIATGGVAQQPVTTFEYQNVGVTIEITPRIHHDDEISLDLVVQLDNISGTGFGGLPTFGNRRVATRLRLADGETSLLAGLIRDEERTSLTGLPGLADIPVIGRLFASNQKTIQETDVVLTLTPHIVRRPELGLEDFRSFVIEGGIGGPLLYEPPLPTPRQEEREEPPREPRPPPRD